MRAHCPGATYLPSDSADQDSASFHAGSDLEPDLFADARRPLFTSDRTPLALLIVALIALLVFPIAAAAQDDSAGTPASGTDSGTGSGVTALTGPVLTGDGSEADSLAEPGVPLVDQEYLTTQLSTDTDLQGDRTARANLDARRVTVSSEIDLMQADVQTLGERIINVEFAMINQQALIDQARTTQSNMALQRTAIIIEVETIRTDIIRLKQALVEKAVVAYMAPRQDADAEIFVSNSAGEAAKKMVLIDAVADRDASIIDQLALRETALARNERTLGDLAAAAAELHRSQVLTREALTSSRAEYEQLQHVLNDKIANSTAEVGQIDAQRTALDQEIAEREAQLRAIAEKRAERRARCESQGGTVTDDGEEIDCSFLGAQPAPGSMVLPVFDTISSEFGLRFHPIHKENRMHNGIDIDGVTGQPIGAAAAGEVFFVGWISGFGNTTLIDHGGGVESLYAHQSDFAVAEGDFVQAGQPIGYVGSTGNSTGPHLHFEVSVNGEQVNPRQFLP